MTQNTETTAYDAAKPPKIQRCIVHIGIEKTGSSSIQHFLSKNRNALRREGFVYPRFRGVGEGSQWGFVAAVIDSPWLYDFGARLGIVDETDADSYRERLISAIDEELVCCHEAHTLVISSEHFHSRLMSPELIQSLKDLLSRWVHDFRIIVYFRRQDRVAISRYSTKLKSGNPNPKVFPPDDVADLSYYYDYGQIYENWAVVFGTTAMVAGLFEREELANGDLISDFCEKSALNITVEPLRKKMNESLNNRGVQLLREFNKQWPKGELSLLNRDRQKLVDRINREYRGKCYPASRQEAQNFFAHFRDSNDKLAKLAFPGRQLALFPDDFDDYPTQVSCFENTVTKEVRGMIKECSDPPVSLASKLYRIVSAATFPRLTTRIGKARPLPPLFLHVGPTKTATTTLKNTLFTHHSELYYLGGSGRFNHTRGCRSREIYEALNPLFWSRRGKLRAPQIRAKLLQQFSDVGDKTVLGSWETLSQQNSNSFKRMVVNTKVVFDDLRIIFTLRNPLTRVPSSYLQALKLCAQQGTHHSIPKDVLYLPFDDWLYHKRLGGHDYRFGFGENIRFAVKYLGVDRVGVFLFEDLQEDPKDFFQRIATFLGIDVDEARSQKMEHMNRALTVEQVTWLQGVNRSAAERKHWLALPIEERTRQFEELRLEGSGDKYRVRLTEEHKAYIISRNQALNRWIEETFEIALGRHDYPL